MRDACKDVSRVPWLRLDLTREMPEWGTAAYGKEMVRRMKVCLDDLEAKGEMGKDGVYWY
jgi:hypothetical protein